MNNFVDIKDKGKTRAATADSGGGDGFDIDKRVNRHELKTKSTVADVAEIKGKMSQIPNFWQQMGIGLGIIGLTFAIIRFIK